MAARRYIYIYICMEAYFKLTSHGLLVYAHVVSESISYYWRNVDKPS